MRSLLLTAILCITTASFADDRTAKYPFVVPYPDGYSESRDVPVARQHEADGSHCDLFLGGHLRFYNKDGDKIAVSGGCGKSCRARKGLGRSKNDLLAEWYRDQHLKKSSIKETK